MNTRRINKQNVSVENTLQGADLRFATLDGVFDISALDISADLRELGRTPVAVICAGVKSILDIGRTLEYLVCMKYSVHHISLALLPVTLAVIIFHVTLHSTFGRDEK